MASDTPDAQPRGPHVCGPACFPGWKLRDIIEFGTVYGVEATLAVIAWDEAHPRRPVECPEFRPRDHGVTFHV